MSPSCCAVGPDSKLLNPDKIAWYNDPDNNDSLPPNPTNVPFNPILSASSTSTSTSCHSECLLKVSAITQQSNILAKHKKLVISSDDESYPNSTADQNIQDFDMTTEGAREASKNVDNYRMTKEMGDMDRKVSSAYFFSVLIDLCLSYKGHQSPYQRRTDGQYTYDVYAG
jgi:hypothetical protein